MILIACDASIKVEQFRSDEPLEGPESSDLAEETSPPLEESLPEDRSSDRETPPEHLPRVLDPRVGLVPLAVVAVHVRHVKQALTAERRAPP